MKKIVIGSMPQDKIRARMLAIARGDYKARRGEPKVWFPSMKSLAEVLSDRNRALLNVIADTKPDSLQDLAKATGRSPKPRSLKFRRPEAWSGLLTAISRL